MFPMIQLTLFLHCLDDVLAPNRRQAFIWSNDDLVHRRIYASPLFNELTRNPLRTGDTLLSVNYVIIVSGDDLSPARHQVIAWANAELLWIGELQCCQLCRRSLHQILPSWQPQISPVTSKLAPWQLSRFGGSLASYIAITWITRNNLLDIISSFVEDLRFGQI